MGKNIRSCLIEISDLSYQKRVWLGRDSVKVSSFTELMCRLYDDYNFKMFIDRIASEKASEDLVKKLRDFDKKLGAFSKNDIDKKNDAEIIQDSLWREIAYDAKIIIDSYGNF